MSEPLCTRVAKLDTNFDTDSGWDQSIDSLMADDYSDGPTASGLSAGCWGNRKYPKTDINRSIIALA